MVIFAIDQFDIPEVDTLSAVCSPTPSGGFTYGRIPDAAKNK